MRKVICPYCNQPAQLVDSRAVYKKSYGMIWHCEPCKAWVGCHKNSKDHIPLGRLANAELRQWKQRAHAAFDPLWREGSMKRRAAYNWLAEMMEMHTSRCHIGMFDVRECIRVVAIMNKVKEPGYVKPNADR